MTGPVLTDHEMKAAMLNAVRDHGWFAEANFLDTYPKWSPTLDCRRDGRRLMAVVASDPYVAYPDKGTFAERFFEVLGQQGGNHEMGLVVRDDQATMQRLDQIIDAFDGPLPFTIFVVRRNGSRTSITEHVGRCGAVLARPSTDGALQESLNATQTIRTSGAVLRAVLGDITKLPADAIVNAANSSLLGGSGVDGAIHEAAGPELYEYNKSLGGCEVGQAKSSPAFRLPARWIIHTVGPIWYGGHEGEPELLASCYRQSLACADVSGATSVSFPAISTGVYGYPAADAARIAVETIRSTITAVQLINFVCFDRGTLELYEELLQVSDLD